MKIKRGIWIALSVVVTTGIFSGCAETQIPQNQQNAAGQATDTGTSDSEAELRAQLEALQKEINALKSSQGTASQGEDTSGQTAQNEAQQNEQAQSQSSQNTTAGSTALPQSQGRGVSANVSVSIEEAKNIALARVPGATEKNMSIGLDYDDGWYVYEGEIMYDGMEYEFDIDANSGTILKWEAERW